MTHGRSWLAVGLLGRLTGARTSLGLHLTGPAPCRLPCWGVGMWSPVGLLPAAPRCLTALRPWAWGARTLVLPRQGCVGLRGAGTLHAHPTLARHPQVPSCREIEPPTSLHAVPMEFEPSCSIALNL